MKKTLEFIITAVETLITIFLVVLIVVTCFQRFSNNGSFFGYRIYTVASSSMIPIYTVGDTLLIQDTNSDSIEVGDALTYMGESGDLRGKIITHQVVSIEEDEDGKKHYHTKGIANDIEDPIVEEEQIFGKVVYRFISLSIIGKITLNMFTLLLCIAFPVAVLVAVELIKIVKEKKEEEIPEFIKVDKNKVIMEETSNENNNSSIDDESLEENDIEEKSFEDEVEDKED